MKTKLNKKKFLLLLSFIPHIVVLLIGLLCMVAGDGDNSLGASLNPLEAFWFGIVLCVWQYLVVAVILFAISLAIHIGLIIVAIKTRKGKSINTRKLVITSAIIVGFVSALVAFRCMYGAEIRVARRNIEANILYHFADEKKTTKNEKWNNIGLFSNEDITRNTMMIDWDNNRFTMITEYRVESFKVEPITKDDVDRINSTLDKVKEKSLQFGDGSIVTIYFDYGSADLITITKRDGTLLGKELHEGYYIDKYDFE